MQVSIKNKFVIFTSLTIFFSVLLVICISFTKTSKIVDDIQNNELMPVKIEALSSQISNELEHPFLIARLMAYDVNIIKYIEDGENDDNFIIKYLNNIKNTQNTSAAFYASNQTYKYFVYDRFIKKLDPNSEKDRWFFNTANASEEFLFNLDTDEGSNNALSVFVNYKIIRDNKTLGVIGVGFSLDQLSRIIAEFNKSAAHHLYLINTEGKIVIGGDNKNLLDALVKASNKGEYKEFAYNRDGKEITAISKILPFVGWTLVMETPKTVVQASTTALAGTLIIYGIVSLLVLSVIGLLIVSKMLEPLDHMTKTLKNLSTDLSVRLPCNSKDEIGEIAAAFNHFIENLASVINDNRNISLDLNDLAENSKRKINSVYELISSQQEATEKLVSAITQIHNSAADVASNAEQCASLTNDAVNNTDEGRQKIELLIESVNDLAQQINTAVDKISNLKESTTKIESILGVIASISEQTNLLALNAAIEAARAGEAGRGFAVVADEVRSLANKTHESTNEIVNVITEVQSKANELSDFIINSQNKANDTIEVAGDTRAVLASIVDFTHKINDMILQISTAAEEQNCVTNSVNENAEDISRVNKDVSVIMDDNIAMVKKQFELANKQKEGLNDFII